MQLFPNTSISTDDGKSVGRIQGVVFNPATRAITHVLIREGFFKSRQVVRPIRVIATEAIPCIVLGLDGSPPDLPSVNHSRPVLTHPARAGLIAEPSYHVDSSPAADRVLGNAHWRDRSQMVALPPVDEPVPADTVTVREGTPVITSDAKTIGSIQDLKLLFDRITHFVIVNGVLYPEKKLIPARWINKYDPAQIQLTVRSCTIDELPTMAEW